MASIYHNPELVAKLAKLYVDGISLSEIARRYAVDRDELSHVIRHKGIIIACTRGAAPLNYGTGTIKLYSKLYHEGICLKNISREYNIDRKFLSYLLSEEGITIRLHGRRYRDNQDAFRVVDNESAAYWLGFLYADGSVIVCEDKWQYRVHVNLAVKDKEHLARFRNWISPGRPIRTRWTTAVKGGPKFESCCISINSKEIVQDMVRLGCMPRKTYKLTFPNKDQVPVEHIHHFMRGYFDGDGCIMKSGCVQIAGTYMFLRSYMKILCSIGMTPVKIMKPSGAYCFQKKHHQQLPLIHGFLYNNATIYLERKKDIFDSAVNNCPLLE